ncbi:unnamed protein product [Euphydryas editha]|uniref:DUF5641 domain-containing protein n=1 Tax=Euphydryas editha TaxID=104508 RepID=A0AAU9TBX0_EUPED|nr:unnamed protein product [Euphydryas editha]
MALRRMTARRGQPAQIWSDNGTNLRGADNELRQAMDRATAAEAAKKKISWRFIPPAAPFMGGAWEQMVRSVKIALEATLNERHPTNEVFRPLTHVSTDEEEPEALTPNHFLLGGPGQVPVPEEFDERDTISKSSWRAAQRLADIFWTLWLREYLPGLQNRREPHGKGPPVKINDLVQLFDTNAPRNLWIRGRVTAVYPGPDGIVRTVHVSTKGGALRRPGRKASSEIRTTSEEGTSGIEAKSGTETETSTSTEATITTEATTPTDNRGYHEHCHDVYSRPSRFTNHDQGHRSSNNESMPVKGRHTARHSTYEPRRVHAVQDESTNDSKSKGRDLTRPGAAGRCHTSAPGTGVGRRGRRRQRISLLEARIQRTGRQLVNNQPLQPQPLALTHEPQQGLGAAQASIMAPEPGTASQEDSHQQDYKSAADEVEDDFLEFEESAEGNIPTRSTSGGPDLIIATTSDAAVGRMSRLRKRPNLLKAE